MRTTTSLLFAAVVACAVASPFVGSASDADAAPRVSPFDGFYYGHPPGSLLGDGSSGEWPIRIDAKGVISANVDATYIDGGGQRGTLSGKVDASGQMSVKGVESRSGSWFVPPIINHQFSFNAVVVLDSGDIAGTTTAGETFVWRRQ